MKTLNPQSIDDMLLYRLGRVLGKAGSLVTRICEGEFGITRREWRVLAQLGKRDGILSSELADAAQLDRARTSRAVTALVARQLVVRVPRPHDRRQVVLHLSDAGRALYEAVLPRVMAIHQALVAPLSPVEADQLDALLAVLQSQADAMQCGADLPKADRRRGGRGLRASS
ncbi:MULTISPECIES: MarR family winged helix-turn-helix transcriptional regulator [Acidovorax]|uniref:DNA-binding transcriptional regulator, MarR family n=1 Tax=Acidovorax soli TaxID=592050 RepID=A0A1H4CKB5_9BURK|nr:MULTISPECIES: MarR family transcriptional regulator [Acidovorax]SEA60794.1 DNA-binding transcriptional regulator, MarR family [Acidovorax soli]